MVKCEPYFWAINCPDLIISHQSGSQFITCIFNVHHSPEPYITKQLYNFRYFILIDILIFKPWILTKTVWFWTVEWFQYIITILIFFLSSPWRWLYPWPKHVRDYCLIKITFEHISTFVGSFYYKYIYLYTSD